MSCAPAPAQKRAERGDAKHSHNNAGAWLLHAQFPPQWPMRSCCCSSPFVALMSNPDHHPPSPAAGTRGSPVPAALAGPAPGRPGQASTSAAPLPLGLLQQHAAWAAGCRSTGDIFSQRQGTNWLVCPAVAAQLLKQYDGGTGAALSKPKVRNRALLRDALTAVSGDTWSRQRPAFLAAAGGGASAQAARHRAAVDAAVQVGLAQAARLRVLDALECARLTAARGIVGAVLGMDDQPSACSSGRAARENVEVLLVSFIMALRQPRRGPRPVLGFVRRDEHVCDSLEAALMQAMRQEAALFLAGAADAAAGAPRQPVSALLPRLLARNDLTLDEAICNANSCMLAGLETTMLLLACSLLHLAERPDVQAAARASLPPPSQPGGRPVASAVVAAVLKEVLRVNPPVMGLPRVVTATSPEGLLRVSLSLPTQTAAAAPAAAEDGPDRILLLQHGFQFAADVLSAAHSWAPPGGGAAGSAAAASGVASSRPAAAAAAAGPGPGGPPPSLFGACCVGGAAPPRTAAASPEPARDDAAQYAAHHNAGSWTWDPLRPTPSASGGDEGDGDRPADPFAAAAPFGIGPRACPAGSLSVVIARDVLQALLPRYSWRLARPEAVGAWMTRTVATPTLLIKGPIGLVFEPVGQESC